MGQPASGGTREPYFLRQHGLIRRGASPSYGEVMATSDSFASSLDTFGGHAELVYRVAEGQTPALGIEQVSTSWQRSANMYGVNPVDNAAPRILTHQEVKDLREPLEDLVLSAQEEIDRLYGLVRQAGYTILFCDTAGVAVEHRGEDAEANHFEYWGTWLGGVWSEEIEGTNGIGTCIAEERPVTVHRGQHTSAVLAPLCSARTEG